MPNSSDTLDINLDADKAAARGNERYVRSLMPGYAETAGARISGHFAAAFPLSNGVALFLPVPGNFGWDFDRRAGRR